MKLIIDIDENVYTRLFDNGVEDYAIVNDDLFAIAKTIRNGTPIPDNATVCDIEQIRTEIYHECCMKYQKTCEIYQAEFKRMRAEIEDMKGGFVDNTKVLNAVQEIIDKYTK